MTHNVNLEYLESLDINKFKFGLNRIKKAVSLLNINKKYKLIHVAGTNGKGSTASYISKILAVSGYGVGLYTSPHLVDIRERIKILYGNTEYIISGTDFEECIEKTRNILEKNKLELTYFEFLTLIALAYFSKKKLDFVVLETGLGGRLDATNVFDDTDVSVITNISLEHTDYLGETVEEIAEEKAGIIKKNSILITGEKNEKVLNIFKNISEKKHTKLIILDKDFKYIIKKSPEGQFNFDYLMETFKLKENLSALLKSQRVIKIMNLMPGLNGKFQVENAAVSIATVLCFIASYPKISFNSIKQGLKNVNLLARNQLINYKGKNILLDSAHNPQAIKKLIEYLKNNYAAEKIIFVIGILRDKDASEIANSIIGDFKKIIITTPLSKRALNCYEFIKYFNNRNKSIAFSVNNKLLMIEDYLLAVDYALSIYKKNDLCVFCGSFYITGGFLNNYE